MLDVIEVACPECAQQPQEECVWHGSPDHPRFHAGRFEVASFIFAAGQRNVVRPELVDEAFASVVDALT